MTHANIAEEEKIVIAVHNVEPALQQRVSALAPAAGGVYVIDIGSSDWVDSVEGMSRALLGQLADHAHAGSTMFVLRTPTTPTPVSMAALAAAHGTIGVGALEGAPHGRRVNSVVINDHTADEDLHGVLAYLADDEAAGFTAGATIDLTNAATRKATDWRLPVLVTGAAGGLGGAVAEAFVSAGRKVVISDLASDALQAQARRLGVVAIACDVTSPEEVASLAAHAELANGVSSLQILHGVGGAGALNELDEGVRERSLRINGTGVWNVVEALLPAVRTASGSVVVLASQAGLIAEPGNGAYCAAKFAAVGLVNALAQTGPDAVRIHALCPGPIDTPLMRNAFRGMAEAAGITYAAYHAQRLSVIPLGRFGKPEHMGAAALMLSELKATGVMLAPTGAFLLT